MPQSVADLWGGGKTGRKRPQPCIDRGLPQVVRCRGPKVNAPIVAYLPEVAYLASSCSSKMSTFEGMIGIKLCRLAANLQTCHLQAWHIRLSFFEQDLGAELLVFPGKATQGTTGWGTVQQHLE